MSDMGRELVDTVLAAQPDYNNARPFLLTSGAGRIVNMEIEFLDDTTWTEMWLFVFDSADPDTFAWGSSANIPRPLVAPIYMQPGDRVSLEASAKWLPFKRGLILAPSSTDSVYTAPSYLITTLVYVDGIASGVTPVIPMNVSYHLMMGC